MTQTSPAFTGPENESPARLDEAHGQSVSNAGLIPQSTDNSTRGDQIQFEGGDLAPVADGGRKRAKSPALERLARIRAKNAVLVKTPAHVTQDDNGLVPVAGAEPGLFNDAIIVGGPIDPAILDRVITIAKGRNRKDRHHWENQTGTVQRLIAQFSKFTRGAKDGECFLQGALVEGATARAAKSVKAFDLQMRDIDNGVPLQEIVEKVRKSGLFAIIYPTHSHLKPETTIPENALKAYAKEKDGSENPTTAHAIDWLIAKKQYLPWVLEGAELLSERRVVADVGKSFVVKHQPLPRARIVFVLDKPFDFEKRPEDHDVLIKEWEELYCGTGTMLDLPYDPTCTTPDRLMYPPRTQTGKCADKIVILNGKLLDLEKVQRVPKPGQGNGKTNNKPRDQFSAFVDGKGGGKGDVKWKTQNLERFAKVAGSDFEAKSWLEHVTKTEPHNTVLCPNSDEHTTGVATGFWVVNASENQGEGFRIKCHHTCDKKSGRDRLWYLDSALEQAGIADAMSLISPEWTPNVWVAQEAERQKEEKAEADAKANRQKLDEGIAALQRDQMQEAGDLAKAIGAMLLDEVESQALIDRIVAAVKPEDARSHRAVDKVRKPLAAVYREARRATKVEKRQQQSDVADYSGVAAQLTGRFKWVLEAGAFYDVRTRKVRPEKVVFNEAYEMLPVQDSGKKVDPRSVLLNNPDSKFDRLAYRADKPETFTENGLRCLNTYRASTLKPVTGDPSPVLDHIWYVFGGDPSAATDEDAQRNFREAECEHFLDVLAYKVQYPAGKVRHAVCIGGEPGLGKGTIARPLKLIFGEDNYVEPDNQEITSGHMGFMENVTCAVVNELRLQGGSDRRDVIGHLKPVITEDTIRIKKLYMDPYRIENPGLLLCFTNYLDDVHIEPGDRRWFVFKSPSKPLQGEARARHFDSLHSWLDGDGPAIFYRWLLDRDVSKFDPNAPAPMTAEKTANMETSKGEVLVRLDELFVDRERPFDCDLINITDALKALRESDDRSLKALSRAKLTNFLRSKGGKPLGGDSSVRYRLPGSSTVQKKRLWAIRDADLWEGMAEDAVDAFGAALQCGGRLAGF